MPSKARIAFDANCADIDRLVEIHTRLTGDAPGRRYDVEVLNKAGIVLITSFWEAYCEDIAAEGLEHLLKHTNSASALPLDLQRIVAKNLKADQHDLAVWKLADDGWRNVLTERLAELQEERNRKLNTPKTVQIDELFMRALGIPRVSSRWYWNNMPRERAIQKLDRYVELRGEIAHRGRAASSVKKSQVVDYYSHVKLLVGKTGGEVSRVLKNATGRALWRPPRVKITRTGAKGS